ncbi:MAG: uL22 family ribosomal protein, partial [Chloroflexota bacterium]|nr:uL22 family ribosomal protein [Chloroflexota bacterium]
MQTRATARFVRMSPQKVRLVTRLISKRPVDEAVAILRFTPK